MIIPNVKVYNMNSPRSGSPVANQFEIETADGTYFQSYKTMIAFRSNDRKITLDRDSWAYSVTTGRYRNQFLNEGIAETRKKIRSGKYALADLNLNN